MSSEPDVPLQTLLGQLLLGRMEGLGAPGVAAFLLGWSSALELLRRTDVVLPTADGEVRHALQQLVDTLERAQRAVLEDDPDEA